MTHRMDFAPADAIGAFGFTILDVNLSLWRAWIGASSQIFRSQQNAWLDALTDALMAGLDLGPEQDIAASEFAATSELDSIVCAYARIGPAWFDAQRRAVDPFSGMGAPH